MLDFLKLLHFSGISVCADYSVILQSTSGSIISSPQSEFIS